MIRHAIGATVLLSVVFGCGVAEVLAPPEDLPDGMTYVINNRAAYEQQFDDTLAGVRAGQVFDNIREVDGCWAAFDVVTPSSFSPGAYAPVEGDYYEYVALDVSDGTVEWQAYGATAITFIGNVSTFVGYAGTFSILDDSQLEVELARMTFTDPQTGQLRTVPLDTALRFDALASVSGNEMIIEAQPDSLGIPPVPNLVYKKSFCFD